jgi:hypothetical protein
MFDLLVAQGTAPGRPIETNDAHFSITINAQLIGMQVTM